MITTEQIDNWFSYHRPKPGAIGLDGKAAPSDEERYVAIRAKAKELAAVIVYNTPNAEDQKTAIRKLREVVMFSNAAIACGGK